MAKEFKLYDKQFAHLKGSVFEWEEGYSSVNVEERASHETRWDMSVQNWSCTQVRKAVYEAEDFLEWQQFRVSLKGWSTKAKLYRLKNYYKVKIFQRLREIKYNDDGSLPVDQKAILDIEKCRIDNYIGALVRGGQLSSDGKHTVLK